jgi:hypothetical protein
MVLNVVFACCRIASVKFGIEKAETKLNSLFFFHLSDTSA